jgi:GR25 family glycosyltransferase involved in LPS biosynthesis
MLILVVSLDSAKDRRALVVNQLKGRDFKFVSAIDGKTDEFMGNPFVTPTVDAIWNSHKEAYRNFLSTTKDYCLILEDDFLVKDLELLFKTIENLRKFDPDLVQVGWLQTGFDIWLLRLNEEISYFLFRLLNRLARFAPRIQNLCLRKMRTRRASQFPSSVIPDSFLPGAHGYLISRRFAESVLKLNNPTFLSADDFLIAITKMRSFNVCRIRKSLIDQFGGSMVDGNRFTQK